MSGGYTGAGAGGSYGGQGGYGSQGIYGRQAGYGQGGYADEGSFGTQGGGGYGSQGGLGAQGRYGSQGGYGGQGGIGMGRSMRRGPKGYQRSDERLKEDISERLMHRWDLDATEVSIDVKNGRVVLEGQVQDRHAKHQIEDLVDDCMGVTDIENRLRVQSQAGRWPTGQGPSTSDNGGTQSASGSSASSGTGGMYGASSGLGGSPTGTSGSTPSGTSGTSDASGRSGKAGR